MKLRQSPQVKSKLSPTLKSWFPILQSSVLDLEYVLGEFVLENPFVEIESSMHESLPSHAPTKPPFKQNISKKYMSDKIEALSLYEKSLYEVLESQIVPPLFPTRISQEIALKIIDDINDEGYFSGDELEIAKSMNVESKMVEDIRQRFAHIDPAGVGAKNALESMKFQLESMELDDELYEVMLSIIDYVASHLDNAFLQRLHDVRLLNSLSMKKYVNCASKELFGKAVRLFRKFTIPPALEFFPRVNQVIPDLFIYHTSNGFEVQLNDAFYPHIFIDTKVDSKDSNIKSKLKEARDLIDALSMRKSTMRKIGLMILEYQYDFFIGGEIKPMKLKDIAHDLGHNPSTISRAVANKYLECNRGIYPLKSFFATALNEEVSNTSIKDFILECVNNENKDKPLSDVQILELIEKKFHIKIVRRTITKYRKQLDVASSSKRKRFYKIKLNVESLS